LAQINLLANGSFEEPRVRPEVDSVTLPPPSMPGWRITDGSVALVPYSNWQPAESQGRQSLLLGGVTGPGSIEQSFATQPGQYYLVSGWLAHDPGQPQGQAQLFLNGQSLPPLVHSDVRATTEDMRWVLFTRRFQAATDMTTLKISGAGAVLDGLAVTFASGPTAPAPFFMVDLSQHLTERLFDPMLGPGNDLIDLGDSLTPANPLKILKGVPFLLDGVILVGPQQINDWKLVQKVTGITVGRKANHLYFLHANHFSQAPVGTRIGTYGVHYADGTALSIPLQYGVDLADMWTYPQSRASAPVAWQGRNEDAAHWDRLTNFLALVGRPLGIHLFLKTWVNPTPDVPITSLDVAYYHASGAPATAPFLVAVTGD
jgi:hypothetical protein